MSVNIDSLNIELTSDVGKASNSFSKLVKSLKEFKEAIKNSDAEKLSASISKLASAAEPTSQSSNNISKLARVLKSMKELGEMKHLYKIAGGISSISKAINSISLSKLKEFNSTFKSKKALSEFAKFENANDVKTEESSPQKIQTVDVTQSEEGSPNRRGSFLSQIGQMVQMFNLGKSGISGWSKGINGLSTAAVGLAGKFALAAGIAVSVGKALNEQVKKMFRFAMATFSLIPKSITGIKNGFVSLKKTFSSARDTLAGIPGTIISRMFPAVKGLFDTIKNFWRSVKRVAFYRLIRTLLKHITSAVKEGVENLYQYSKIFEGTFSKSLDRVSTSFLYLRNSIGAAVSPLINALAPAIDFVVDRLIELINWFNRAMATLTGASSWTKALRYPKEFAESANGAGKALKDLRFLIAGFDELNVLPSKNTGGGGASNPDYSKMFEEQTLEKIGFFEKIREKFLKGDWAGLGKEFALKFDSIIKGINAESIGKGIADKLNNVIETAKSFFNTTGLNGTFYELGAKLSEGIKGFDSKFDYAGFGKTVAGFWNSIFNTVYGFVNTFPWASIGKNWGTGFDNMFRGIKWNTIADTASTSINGVFTTIKNFIENFNLAEHITAFTNSFNKMIRDIKWADIGKTINDGFHWVLDGAIAFVKTFDWSAFGQSIADMLERIEWDDIFGKVREFGGGLVQGVGTFVGKVKGPIKKMLDSFFKNLRQFFQENKDEIKKIFYDIVDMIPWDEIAAFMFEVKWEIFKVKAKMFFVGLGSVVSGGLKFIGGLFEGLANWIAGGDVNQTIKDNFDAVTGGEIDFSSYWGDQKEIPTPTFSEEELKKGRETVTSIWEGLKTKATGLFTDIQMSADKIFPGISSTIINAFKGARDISVPLAENLSGSSKTAFEGMGISASGWRNITTTAFDDVNTSASGTFPSIFEKIKSVFSSDEGSAITNAKTSTEDWKTKSLGYFEEVGNGGNTIFSVLSQKINQAFSEMKSAAITNSESMSSQTTKNFGSIQTSANSVFPDVLNRIRETFKSAKDSAVKDSEEMANKTTGFFGSVFSKISEFMQKVREAKQSASELQSLNAVSVKTSVHTKATNVRMRAAGGLPDVGEMFIARESGPELVGKIGGSSAVANNDQIVEAVSKGVAEAVASVMQSANKGGSTKNINLVVNGRQLLTTVIEEARREAMRTGVNPLEAI